MNLVTLDRIDKQYSERPLLESASLLINLGDRIGLIGVNGSGKTTLLKIIAGSEPPDKGTLTVTGGVRIEYLAQEPPLDDNLTVLETIFRSQSPQMRLLRAYEAASAALQRRPDDAAQQQQLLDLSAEMDLTQGWSAETNAKTVLTQLGITDFDARVGTLSGGQRKRVALARALIDRADLLILDEPTNHIDAATVAWLEEYLATTPGALLMVTHDRYFLDRVANRIVEIDRRELVSYPGNYTHYVEQHAERHERLAEEIEVVLWYGGGHGRLRAQVGDRGDEILVAHAVKGHQRRRGAPVVAHAVAQDPRQLAVRPLSDTGFGVGRQVARVDRAERQRKAMVAGERRRRAGVEAIPLLARQMAVGASCGAVDQRLAGLDDRRIGRSVQIRIRRVERPFPAQFCCCGGESGDD